MVKKIRKHFKNIYPLKKPLPNGQWEWVVRYDDHGGTGLLHRHFRISLTDNSQVESTAGIKRYKNKDYELTWVCNDIKRNYLTFRSKFLKNMGLDLY